MKTLLLLLFPLIASAQKCEFHTVDHDSIHNIVSMSTNPVEIAPGIEVFFSRLNNTRIMYMTSKEYGCSSPWSYVILRYTDGSSKLISQIVKADECDNPTIGGYISLPKAVESMDIRFTFDDKIEIVNKDFIIQGLQCLK